MEHEIRLEQCPAREQTDPPEQDAALARAIAGGDADAWDRFFDRFSAWTYRFAYHHLDRNHADAEDLCSDILMTAARGIGSYDATRGSLDVWLLGVARHRLARFCRRRRMEEPLIPDLSDDDPAGTDDFLIREDTLLTRETVNRALSSLPERQSSALVRKYVEGYSTEEIARMTDSTPKAVESLLVRARCALRKALSAITGGESDV